MVCVNAHLKVSDLINSYLWNVRNTTKKENTGPTLWVSLPTCPLFSKPCKWECVKWTEICLIVSRMLQCIVFCHGVLISGMVDRCPSHWADSLHLPSRRPFDTTVGCPCFSLRIMLLWMLMSRSLPGPEIDLEKILEAGRTGSPAGKNVNLKTKQTSNCFPQYPCI